MTIDLRETSSSLYASREVRGIKLAEDLLRGRGLAFERHQQSALSTEPPLGSGHRAVLGGWILGDRAQRWAIAPKVIGRVGPGGPGAPITWSASSDSDVALLQRMIQRASDLHRIRGWHDSSAPVGTPMVDAFVGSCSLDVLICVVLAELMPGVGWALEQLEMPQLCTPEWHVWLERAMVGVGAGGRREASDHATQLADTLAGEHGAIVGEMLEWAWRIANPNGPLYLCQVDSSMLGLGAMGSLTLTQPGPPVAPSFVLQLHRWESSYELDAARERLIAFGLIDRDGRVEASDALTVSGGTIIETMIPRFGWVRWIRSGLHGAMAGQRWAFMDRGWW